MESGWPSEPVECLSNEASKCGNWILAEAFTPYGDFPRRFPKFVTLLIASVWPLCPIVGRLASGICRPDGCYSSSMLRPDLLRITQRWPLHLTARNWHFAPNETRDCGMFIQAIKWPHGNCRQGLAISWRSAEQTA